MKTLGIIKAKRGKELIVAYDHETKQAFYLDENYSPTMIEIYDFAFMRDGYTEDLGNYKIQ